MDKDGVIEILREQNLVSGSNTIEFRMLEGGVSSDIQLITDGDNTYVVKQALPKLQVEDDWYADITRNSIEQDFIRFLRRHNSSAVPKLLFSDSEHHLFVMEFLDSSFRNWKQQMLGGIFRSETASSAAILLSEIHNYSRNSQKLKRRFNNTNNFHSLRTEPYLITTGKRHPELKDYFLQEAERVENHREALVHGDFSPKNIMVKDDRVVILDHEVAWYGDPAFDVAFFLNHLYLKMLLHYSKSGEVKDLTTVAWKTYRSNMSGTGELHASLERRVGRLLLMLMLARVDGKSPVEYLNDKLQNYVRSFVHKLLPTQQFDQDTINSQWKHALKGATFED